MILQINGKVEVSYNMGFSKHEMRVDRKVDDGKMHTVCILILEFKNFIQKSNCVLN